jgi:ribosomal protein S12 methylthiotransferase accessory factor
MTRLGDITGMDRIGVPVYCAIVPKSSDMISVYTGKGLDPIDAKVGALMEAIERQTALRVRPREMVGSVKNLSKEWAILDPRDVLLELQPNYSETTAYNWVCGHDLLSDLDTLVPASLAGYFWQGLLPGPFEPLSFTNGLASGNVREEAICQALCELIERDAWTLADMSAHVIPWARRRLVDAQSAEVGDDDFEVFQSLELEDEPCSKAFKDAGLQPVLHDITSDVGIATIFAAVMDEAFPDFPMIHAGLGTHPDARVAVTRALTEAAQSRCVDIQGTREDLSPPEAESTRSNSHTRRISLVDRRIWTINHSQARKRLSDLPSVSHDDVQADLDCILCALKRCGVHQVIVVDYTPPDAPYAVVRAIVPELESWSVNHSRLGKRALAHWKANV